jgi:2-hydroxychromene-2-carboxylate isomerase
MTAVDLTERDVDGAAAKLFDFMWVRGKTAEGATFEALLDSLDLNPSMLEYQVVEMKLNDTTQMAISVGAFAVPTFGVRNGKGKLHTFTGFDKLDMLQDFLAGDGFFDSAAWAAVAKPVAGPGPQAATHEDV